MSKELSAAPNAPKRRRRKEARPGEIIAAGLAEFADKGFAAAKLEDVATRAGVVKGTIYRYFESKEALFEAALKAQVAPVFNEVLASLERFPGSTPDLLRMVIPTIYKELFGSGIHVLMRIIIAEGGRFPAIAEFYHRESITRGKTIIEAIVHRGVARGEFRPGAAADLPMVAIAPAVMAAVWTMTFDRFEPIPIERFLEAHLDLVLNGLQARPDGGIVC